MIETAQETIWQSLTEHLTSNFYQPDFEAIRAVFAAVHSHYAAADPVWLFVIGPSGSGKTSIVINCISTLPDVMVASDLTPRSFLVGTPGGQEMSILNKPSIIMAFKDFTTMISKREEDQREIVATLREVYDGMTSRKTATTVRRWIGKATVIAAVTPAIERAWSIHRDLGERFEQVRWANSSDPTKVARMARMQCGREKDIAKTMQQITNALFEQSEGIPAALFTDDQGDRFDAAATVVARLRRHVVRDSNSSRPIIDVSPAEEPTRLSKSTSIVARHHAALFGKDRVDAKDMKVAMRVIADTVPSSRMKIVQAIPPESGVYVSSRDIRELTEVHKNTVLWQTDELEAIGVIKLGQSIDGERTCTFTKEFEELWLSAGF